MLRDLLAEWKVTLRTGCRLAQVTAEGAVVTGPQGGGDPPRRPRGPGGGLHPPALPGRGTGWHRDGSLPSGDGSKVGSVMTAIASAYTVARAL